MDYKFIENAKLRRLMQKARHKRKVLNNPKKEPEHKNAKIFQKYKNTRIQSIQEYKEYTEYKNTRSSRHAIQCLLR